MPHFSEKGNDTYICQKCARIYDSVDHPSVWQDKVGNVCPNCIKTYTVPKSQQDMCHQAATGTGMFTEKTRPVAIGLIEHCCIESGFPIGSRQLTDYINRYYGHG